jgi:hypothetical protein
MSGLPTLWEPVPSPPWRVVTTPERKERAGTGSAIGVRKENLREEREWG